MAWVTSSPRITGTIITAVDWNQDVVSNTLYLKGQAGTVTVESSLSVVGIVTVTQQVATPSAPGASLTSIYAKSDGQLYYISGASGVEAPVGSSGYAQLFLLMGA